MAVTESDGMVMGSGLHLNYPSQPDTHTPDLNDDLCGQTGLTRTNFLKDFYPNVCKLPGPDKEDSKQIGLPYSISVCTLHQPRIYYSISWPGPGQAPQ